MEQWHPILAAEEGPTGTWRLIDGTGKTYGTIEIRRVMNGTDVRDRAVFRGEVIGWATSLRSPASRSTGCSCGRTARAVGRSRTGAAR